MNLKSKYLFYLFVFILVSFPVCTIKSDVKKPVSGNASNNGMEATLPPLSSNVVLIFI